MREINFLKLMSVLAITTLIFLSGFVFAKYTTGSKISDLEQAVQDISLQAASVETEYNLLLENPCSFGGFNRLTASLDALAEKLLFIDMQSSHDQARLESLQQNYFLLETKHWLFVQKLNKDCSTSYNPVLYFYSNAGDCEVCEAQGIVLSEIKKTHPETMIYSFDINTEYSLVSTLKDIYNVTTTPSLIIDGKLYNKFLTQADLEKILPKPKLASSNQNQTVACNSSNSTVA